MSKPPPPPPPADEFLLVEPHFPGDEDGSKAEDFWAKHAADPRGVVLVLSQAQVLGAFSSRDLAVGHIRSDRLRGVVVVPMIIDAPQWGQGKTVH